MNSESAKKLNAICTQVGNLYTKIKRLESESVVGPPGPQGPQGPPGMNGTDIEVLNDLEDVIINNPVENQYLCFDGENWINANISLQSTLQNNSVMLLNATNMMLQFSINVILDFQQYGNIVHLTIPAVNFGNAVPPNPGTSIIRFGSAIPAQFIPNSIQHTSFNLQEIVFGLVAPPLIPQTIGSLSIDTSGNIEIIRTGTPSSFMTNDGASGTPQSDFITRSITIIYNIS